MDVNYDDEGIAINVPDMGEELLGEPTLDDVLGGATAPRPLTVKPPRIGTAVWWRESLHNGTIDRTGVVVETAAKHLIVFQEVGDPIHCPHCAEEIPFMHGTLVRFSLHDDGTYYALKPVAADGSQIGPLFRDEEREARCAKSTARRS